MKTRRRAAGCELRAMGCRLRATGNGLRAKAARSFFLAVVCSPLAVDHAHAEKPFAAPEAARRVVDSPAGGFANVMLSLLIVLAVVFAVAWVMRRLRGGSVAARGAIQVLADMPLGAKERAVLVQVGKEQLLLGVAPGRVNTLHVFAEGKTPIITDHAGAAATPAAVSTRPDFKAILRRSLGL